MAELLSVQEALGQLLSAFQPVNAETTLLDVAIGRVLSENIFSTIDLPSFDNSSMDGYALRAVDTASASKENPVTLPVEFDIPAGASPGALLNPGQAARIMTGAPLPPGADSVIPIEEITINPGSINGLPSSINLFRPTKPGDFIRPRGQDLQRGQLVLHAHQFLRPQEIGLLASLGITQIPVFRRPRIALISSGDELIQPDQALLPGKIRDSNTAMLAAQIQKMGAEVIRLGIVPDDPQKIRDILDAAVHEKVDLIISSAGVSVGVYDFVKNVVENSGQLVFWRVNMRPGKPLAFGLYRGIPLLGLPGNPVSSFVSCEVFVYPVIARLSGRNSIDRNEVKVCLKQGIESDGRESYLRAIISVENGQSVACIPSHQGSGNIYSLVLANALLIIPSGVKSLPVGAYLEAWLLNE